MTTINMEHLEKVDIVRERTGLSLTEARELLEDANWDVLEALITYEQDVRNKPNQWEVRGQEVVDKVKGLLKEGNITKIRIKSQDRTLIELPISVGVVGAILAPKLAVLGAATCMLTKCTLEVERAKPDTAVVADLEDAFEDYTDPISRH